MYFFFLCIYGIAIVKMLPGKKRKNLNKLQEAESVYVVSKEPQVSLTIDKKANMIFKKKHIQFRI